MKGTASERWGGLTEAAAEIDETVHAHILPFKCNADFFFRLGS